MRILYALIAILLSLSILAEAKIIHSKRDVCILGAGASGMSAAAFLKDKGKNPLIIERRKTIGGNCHTVHYDEEPYWMDNGIRVFVDSKVLNELGLGKWNFDSKKFVQRFVGEDNLIPYVLPNRTSYAADFYQKIILRQSQKYTTLPKNQGVRGLRSKNNGWIEDQDEAQKFASASDNSTAFERYSEILMKYPWINTGDYPEVIADELIQPFDQFIAANQLEELNADYFRNYLSNFRNETFSDYTALSAMADSGLWTVAMLYNQAGFIPDGGCIKLYEGIRDYIGKDNILLNKDVFSVERNEHKVTLKFRSRSPFQQDQEVENRHQEEHVECEKLIVSFPPSLEKLTSFKDLSKRETNLFKHVTYYNLYPFAINLKPSPTIAPDYFCFFNYNISDPYRIPYPPSVTNLCRFGVTGPTGGYFVSGPKNRTDVIQSIIRQISGLDGLFTFNGPSSFVEIDQHYLSPHFDFDAFKNGANPYNSLNRLQGHKNTYWFGGITSIDWAHAIWQKSFNQVQKYFKN